MNEDDRLFSETVTNTAPEKLPDMNPEALDACYRYFVDVSPDYTDRPRYFQAAMGRISLLRDEMQAREDAKADADREQVSKQRHEQMQRLGRWTLAAAVVAILVPLGIALISETRSSKLPPAASSQALPESSPAPTAAPSPSPSATEESPSATPEASPVP